MRIGEKIKILRTTQKLNQDDLAKKINVSRATIISYEKGKTIPSPEILVTLSKVLDTNISEFTSLQDSSISNQKVIIPVDRLEPSIPMLLQNQMNGVGNAVFQIYQEHYLNLIPDVVDSAHQTARAYVSKKFEAGEYSLTSVKPEEIIAYMFGDYYDIMHREIKNGLIRS